MRCLVRSSLVCSAAILSLAVGPGGLRADDCNANGIDDRLDLQPRIQFEAEPAFGAGQRFRFVVAGDLDSDSDADLVAVESTEGESLSSLWTLKNDGSGAFVGVETKLGLLPAGPLAVADLDGDRDVDIAMAPRASALLVFLNQGGGVFGSPQAFSGPLLVGTGSGGSTIAAADFDRDRDIDLVVSHGSSKLIVLLNNGRAGFDFSSTIAISAGSPFISALAAAQLNNDNAADILVGTTGSPGAHSLHILVNQGNATFTSHIVEAEVGGKVTALVARRMDFDGDLDIVAVTRSVNVLLNYGDAAFPYAAQFAYESAFLLAEVFDADLDNDLDVIAIANVRQGSTGTVGRLEAFANEGDGALRPAGEFLLATDARGAAAADFDGDGKVDLAIAGEAPGGIILVRNRAQPPASADTNANGVPDDCEIPRFHRGDANDDGAFNLTDILFMLGALFAGVGDGITCEAAADANDDGVLTMTDAIFGLGYLFQGGLAPPPPGPPDAPCGPDPGATPVSPMCGEYASC